MMLQQVKIFRPDDYGCLHLVQVISQKEIIERAEEKYLKKNKWKKKARDN